MNKATAGKLLSAAALANMAVAGFAAGPVGAAAHPTAGTISGPHIEKAKLSARQSSQLEAERLKFLRATAAQPRGFVPKPSAGVRPDTETGCSGHVCLGLYGGAQHVSYVNEHWFNGTGCHIAHFYAYSPGALTHFSSYTPPGYFCSKQQATWPSSKVAGNYPAGTSFCGSFNNITGFMCEPVR